MPDAEHFEPLGARLTLHLTPAEGVELKGVISRRDVRNLRDPPDEVCFRGLRSDEERAGLARMWGSVRDNFRDRSPTSTP